MAFPSVYEMTNPLTTVRKQHLVEWFSGDVISTDGTGRWNNHGSNAPLYLVGDGENCGIRLTGLSVGYASMGLNNKNAFDVGQCTFISTFRRNSDNQNATAGMRNNPVSSTNGSYMLMDTNANNIQLLNNGGNPTTTVTTTPIHRNWTTVKIENDRANTSIKLSLDGVLASNGTSTTNISSAGGQPSFFTMMSSGSGTTTLDVNYCEVYNT